MAIERINRYKKTANLRFPDVESEDNFNHFQASRGRSTSIYALITLVILNLAFAFLEHWILGLNSIIPLVSYLVVAGIAGAGVAFSLVSHSLSVLKLRTLVPGVLTLSVLLLAVILQQYRIYHALEMALLLIWMGSLNILSFRHASILSLLVIVIFSMVAYLSGATDLKLAGLIAVLTGALAIAAYLSYMLERLRRMMFLTKSALTDVYNRQESWAYTLIDLDMGLSGIRDFKELISRLLEFLKTAIHYDSYVLTSLEGKGPKPKPDEVDGTLFEQEEQTIWSDELMTKLSQTRQATTSSQFEYVKGFMGKEKKNFLHFRMDIPVFNDSSLAGVISLRRQSEPFDDLDMTASVSLAAQAMMIYKRTLKSSQMSETLLKQVALEAKKPRVPEVKNVPPATDQTTESVVETTDVSLPKESSPSSVDLDVTQDPTVSTPGEFKPGAIPEGEDASQGTDETIVPQEVVKQMQKDTASVKKTITLLSRENADQIAVDRYRTAAVEGEPLSILLIEVDGLSAIREKDGDQTAYKVFAGIVKNVFSKIDKERDVLGRYGQNGLSVLLPRVDMNAAEKFAESIRQYAETATFKTPYGERGATLSIGVAAITDETGNYDSMVKRADMALFVAKKNGRNCVKVRL